MSRPGFVTGLQTDTVPGAARAHRVMLALVAIACGVLWAGEHILVEGGLGFDGRIYGTIVREPALALGDAYYVQRALPSWIVHSGLRILGLPIDNARIIHGFLALNSVLLLTATALWGAIADRLQLSIPARWVGFIGLFCNFGLSRMPFYYPVSTDPSAFALGMTIAFASLSGRQWLLGAALVGCTFTWPAGTIFAAPLLLWPPGRAMAPDDVRPTTLGTVAAVAAASLFLAWFVWIYVVRGQTVRASHHSIAVVEGVVWIGIAGAVGYIILAVRSLLAGASVPYLVGLARSIQPSGLMLLVSGLIPATVAVSFIAQNEPGLTTRAFVGNVVFFSSTRPFLFLVANIVYFGPVLLLLFSSRLRIAFMQSVRMLGPGWIALVVAAVGLSLNSEARQNILQYPAIVVLIAMAADRSALSARATWCVAIFAVAFSKLWLTINTDPPAMIDASDPSIVLAYDRYFAHHGPWMSNEAYLLHGLGIAIAVAVLWAVLRAEKPVAHPAGIGGLPVEHTPKAGQPQ